MPDRPQDSNVEEQPENESRGLLGMLLSPLALFVIAGLLTFVFYQLRGGDGEPGSVTFEIAFILSAAVLIAIVISEACDPFADAAQWVGIQLRLPSSVRGATLDAIASSMPELFTGLFFVVVALSGTKDAAQRMLEGAEGYGSTIATCAGSSIYNLILIPAVCAIAISFSRPKKPEIEVTREVVNRDGMWVIFTQAGLLWFLFQPELSWWMGVVAILAYVGYVLHLYIATRRFRSQLDEGTVELGEQEESASMLFGFVDVKLTAVSAPVILIVSTLLAALACYFLVGLTNDSAERLHVTPFFVAVILTAAVSSIPDTFMSLGSARRGDDSGAMSNVFGSNIFDICIGMSIPLLVGCYLNDWNPIVLVNENDDTLHGVVILRVLLFVLTAIVMAIMWKAKRVTRQTGWFFCFLYALFVTYAVLGALGIGV